MRFLLYILIVLPSLSQAQFVIRGHVITDDNKPLAGAIIRLENSDEGAISNQNGEFRITSPFSQAVLNVSFMGFRTQKIELSLPQVRELVIKMQQDEKLLEEVVVSTGYQLLSPERTTGSFSKIGNALVNRRAGPDLISRLEDLAPGMVFNKGKAGAAQLLIRGQHTIHSSAAPLIIIDNFPYEGDLNNINPNDVESVTILKDASAASIWGARAGNGVIVVTTKAGVTRPFSLSYNFNYSYGKKPDIYYQPRMSTADFIDLEKEFFYADRYSIAINSQDHFPLTPVAELLLAVKSGTMTAAQADREISSLMHHDVRNDYNKYLYQNSVNQQHSIGLSGGNDQYRYYLSGGYDNNRLSLVGNRNERYTFNISNNYSLSKKFELGASVYYTENITQNNNPGLPTYTNPLSGYSGTRMYPYAQLATNGGEPLEVINQYRLSFIGEKSTQGFLDWSSNPLDELHSVNKSSQTKDIRINLSATYDFHPDFSLKLLYQFNRGETAYDQLYGMQSYFVRNEINRFTQISSSGDINRPVPVGGIRDQNIMVYDVHSPRLLLNYNKKLAEGHEILAMAGGELRDYQTNSMSTRLYGYDAEHATAKAVDYISVYNSAVNPMYMFRIENKDSRSEAIDRYLSYYANGSYTYKKRYILSVSGRRDMSNLYGVSSNQKGVPLWSAGLAWNIHDEKFYNLNSVPYVKLRGTYGSAGNSNKNVSAFTTANFSSQVDQNTRLPYATIINPPNPSLRWEQVSTLNFGLDFRTNNQRLTGTIEYYHKRGRDLIGVMPYPGSSGVKNLTGNYAQTKGKGIDMQISASWLRKSLNWNTIFNFSYVTDKVVRYDLTSPAAIYLGSADGMGTFPLEGRPLYSLYSLQWAGLDTQTGDPLGYVDGKVSNDYYRLISIPATEMIFNGSARPVSSGSIINTLLWKGLSLSFNVNYKLGYYFRRSSVSYRDILTANVSHGDYGNRWKEPGDEGITHVPSRPSSVNDNRDAFYAFSEVLVSKGDHIRLQDVNLSYQPALSLFKKLPFKDLQVYVNINNLGILWKADQSALDPDYYFSDYRPALSASIGLRANFQ